MDDLILRERMQAAADLAASHARPPGAGAARRRGRRRQARTAGTVALLLVAVVAPLTPAVRTLWERSTSPPSVGAPTQAAPSRPRYQTTSMVLQSRDHGSELCLGDVADSFPPLCRGVPITNWRWDQVKGQQAAGGTTWGTYHLVGTYDGTSFTVIRVNPPQPPPTPQPSAAERFKDEPKSPCSEPKGGWPVPDPARRSERYLDPVTRAARAQPDFAGLWLSYLKPMGHNVAEDPGEFVLNLAFTGELARHQAQLRPLWGGRLCITRQQRSYRQLLRIQHELQGTVGTELGLRVLSTGIVEDANAVNLQVVVLDTQTRKAIDARYGAGAVQATAALTPAA
jgi:hypothetical protein